MSEGVYEAPPPPPPPPPPPVVPPTSTFDFVRPFTFVFEDPNWVPKILVGGLFYLAGIFIVGWFFLLGYCARLARNVINNVTYPLPEWEDLGEYFGEGLRIFAVILVYVLPLIVMAILVGIPSAIMSDSGSEGARVIGSSAFGCLVCLMMPFSLAITLWIPAALLRSVVQQRFGAAFEFREIWQFIRANLGNYLLAVVVWLVARFIAGFGFFLLCIGLVFTGFWSFTISTYAFAQTYRSRI
jgi:hypothetical protein